MITEALHKAVLCGVRSGLG